MMEERLPPDGRGQPRMHPAEHAQEPPRSRPSPRSLSSRFLPSDHPAVVRTRRTWGPAELFAEGQWLSIRVSLERQGWHHSQIELVHDQLRQGWPLAIAKRNVAVMTGHCPLRARRDG